MTDPSDDAERQIAGHIAAMVTDGLTRGVAGDWPGAVETMRPLFEQYGPNEAYAWIRAMMRTMPRQDCACGSPAHPAVAQYDAATDTVIPRDIDDPDVPTGIRALARMLAAHANDDDDTVRALWDAVVANEDTQATLDILQRTLQYAIASAQHRAAELS